ncbi:MAG: hypothetical protein ACYTFG_16240 [Planctomycetota bacterium]|jgi:hypothetical protein
MTTPQWIDASDLDEMERVTRRGGTVILCPGNNDENNEVLSIAIDRG